MYKILSYFVEIMQSNILQNESHKFILLIFEQAFPQSIGLRKSGQGGKSSG